MGYKARFVARGIDYEETFAARFATRLIKDDKLTDGCEKNFRKSSI